MPTLEDEIIIKLIELLHVSVDADMEESRAAVSSLLRLTDLFFLNPYNAFKFTDAIYFLAL